MTRLNSVATLKLVYRAASQNAVLLHHQSLKSTSKATSSMRGADLLKVLLTLGLHQTTASKSHLTVTFGSAVMALVTHTFLCSHVTANTFAQSACKAKIAIVTARPTTVGLLKSPLTLKLTKPTSLMDIRTSALPLLT